MEMMKLYRLNVCSELLCPANELIHSSKSDSLCPNDTLRIAHIVYFLQESYYIMYIRWDDKSFE